MAKKKKKKEPVRKYRCDICGAEYTSEDHDIPEGIDRDCRACGKYECVYML